VIDYIAGTSAAPRTCLTLAAWVAVCHRDINWFLDCAGRSVNLDAECLFFARLGSTRCVPGLAEGTLNPTHRMRMAGVAVANRDSEMLRELLLRGARVDTPILYTKQLPHDVADRAIVVSDAPTSARPILEWVHQEVARVTQLHNDCKASHSDQEAFHYFLQARAFNEMLAIMYRSGHASPFSRVPVTVEGRKSPLMSIPFPVQSGLIDYNEWRAGARTELRVIIARHTGLTSGGESKRSSLDVVCELVANYDDRLSSDSPFTTTGATRNLLWESLLNQDLAIWNERSKRFVATRAQAPDDDEGDDKKKKSKRKLKLKAPTTKDEIRESKDEKAPSAAEPDEAATFQYQLYDRLKRVRKLEVAETDAELARELEALSTAPAAPPAPPPVSVSVAAAAGGPRPPRFVDLSGADVTDDLTSLSSTRKRRH